MSDVKVKTRGTFSGLYKAIETARGGEDQVKGSKVLYLKTSDHTSTTVSATKFWAGRAGRDASTLIFKTIEKEYGNEVAKRVFKQVIGRDDANHAKVSLDKLRALKNMLRYERKQQLHRGLGIKPATLWGMHQGIEDLKEKRKARGKGDFKPGKHLRFTAEKRLYVHTSWSTGFKNRFGLQTSRQDKRTAAGTAIWKSIANEHGESVADEAFRKVFTDKALHAGGADHKIAVTMEQFEAIEQTVDAIVRVRKTLDSIPLRPEASPLDVLVALFGPKGGYNTEAALKRLEKVLADDVVKALRERPPALRAFMNDKDRIMSLLERSSDKETAKDTWDQVFCYRRQAGRTLTGQNIMNLCNALHIRSQCPTNQVLSKDFGNNADRASGDDHKIDVTMERSKAIQTEIASVDPHKVLLNDSKTSLNTINHTQKASPPDAIDRNSKKIDNNKNNNNSNNDKVIKNVSAIQNRRADKIAKNLGKVGFMLLEKKQELKNLASVSDKDWKELFALPDDMPEAFTKSEARKKISTRMRQAVVIAVAKYGLQAARCARQEMIDRIKDDVNKNNNLKTTFEFIEKKYVKKQKISKARDPKIQYHPFPFSKEEMEKDFATKNGNKYVERKSHYFHLFTNPESKLSFPDSKFKKPLSALDQNSVLKITGHGSSTHKDMVFLTKISDEADKQRKNGTCLTAADLAQQLKEDGLPLDHKLIRLNTCYAGGDFQDRWEAPPSKDKLNKPKSIGNQDLSSFLAASYVAERPKERQNHKIFGQQLAMELRKLGYKNTIVGAYPGAVAEPSDDDIREDRFRSKITIVPNVLGQRKAGLTKGLCRYFDGDGNRVKNPRNPDKRLNYVEELEIVENVFQDFPAKDDSKL